MPTPPNTENYTLGKGRLSIAEFSGGAPGAYYDAGNAPSVEVEPTTERLPHYSSRSGAKLKDKNPVISNDYSINITLDEMATENIQKFLLASLSGGIINMFGNVEGEFALRFVEDNPAGPNRIWHFWRGTLAPNGPMQLIGDEWRQMSYRFEGLADSVNHPLHPYAIASLSSSSSKSSSSSSSSSSS
jgi:hypothetical protein